MMATLDDEERLPDEVDNDVGMGIAVGCPSYGDLVEENSYLRSEVCRFYEQSAIRPLSPITKCPTDLLVRMKELEDEIAEEKCQHGFSIANIASLQSELLHLQTHSLEQAAAAQILGQKTEEVEYELHLANAELLQILPLRMKLTECNKKVEALRGEVLMAGNQILSIGLACDQMSAKNDLSQRCCDELQKISDDLQSQSIHAKAEMADLHEQIHILERTLHEKVSTVKSQEVHIKKLDEMIMILRTDSAHWERKSISASKELSRLNSASQAQILSQHNDLKDKNCSLKNKLKVRDDAIKTILKQSRNRHSVPSSRRKRSGSRCVSMRACISSPQRSPQNALENEKASCDSTTVSSSMKRKSFPDHSQPITIDKISIAAIKEMGIEITCDSVDDQDICDINNDKNENTEPSCICGGFSFLSRRKSI